MRNLKNGIINLLLVGALIIAEAGAPVFAVENVNSDAENEIVETLSEEISSEDISVDEIVVETMEVDTDETSSETSEDITYEDENITLEDLGVVESGECGTGLTYQLKEDSFGHLTLIISGTGNMNNYSMTADGSSAPWGKYGDKITRLVINSGVKNIGAYAFYGCDSIEGTVTIPDTVEDIGVIAFGRCSKISAIELSEGLTSIGTGAFMSCTGLICELNLPSTLTTIGSSAFYDCSGLTGNITFPSGLTKIDTSSFYGCSGLTGRLVIPGNITSIEPGAFYACSGFTSIEISEGIRRIGETAFKGCTGLKGSLILPEGLRVIDSQAFEDCSGLDATIILPSSLASIYNDVFVGCTGVQTIKSKSANEIPLPTLDNATWYKEGDSSKTPIETIIRGTAINSNIEIVKSGTCGDDLDYRITGNADTGYTVTISGTGGMNDYATSGSQPWNKYVDNITAVVIEEGPTEIGQWAFYNCENLRGNLIIPNSVKIIGKNAFYNCGFDGKLVIPEGVTTIEEGAFWKCSNLKGAIIIPKSVTSIGQMAFDSCSNLTGQLIIPEGVTTIARQAFNGCSGLSGNIIIPKNVTTIDNRAFAGCTGINGTIIIPESVNTIHEYAFEGCTNVTSFENKASAELTLPVLESTYWYLKGDTEKKAITTLAEGIAVRADIYEAKCGPDLYYQLNGNDYDGYSLVFSGSGAMTAYDTNYPWVGYVSLIKSIVFCEGMISIEDNAFAGMTNLTGDIVIPDSIMKIGKRAFADCDRVTGISCGSGLMILDSEAFKSNTILNVEFRNNSNFTAKNGIIYENFAGGNKRIVECLPARGLKIGQSEINLSNDPTLKNVVEMLEGAFSGCTSIQKVDFTGVNKLVYINVRAFENADSLALIDLPDNISEIGNKAFSGIDCGVKVIARNRNVSLSESAFDGTSAVNQEYYVTYSDAASRTKAGNIGVNIDEVLDEEPVVTPTVTPTPIVTPGEGTPTPTPTVTPGEGTPTPTPTVTPGEGTPTPTPSVTPEVSVTPTPSSPVTPAPGIKYKVVFDTKAASYEPVYVTSGDTITMPTPTSKGLVFRGWYPTLDGSGEPYTSSTKITKDVTLYAFWYYSEITIKGVEASYEYTGAAIVPQITVYDGKNLLTEKVDYTITYKNNTNPYAYAKGERGFLSANAPSVIVTGKGNYNGTKTAYFKIEPYELNSPDISVNDIAVTLETGKVQKPLPVVMRGKTKLINNRDYTLEYYDSQKCENAVIPTSSGKYYIKISGEGKYKGSIIKEFEIAPKANKLISKLTIKKLPNKTYTGSPITLADDEIVVMDGKLPLTQNTDYKVTYSNNTEIGTASVTVTGTGEKYSGSKTVNFKITGNEIKKATISGFAKSYIYTGKPCEQTTLMLTYDGEELLGTTPEKYKLLSAVQKAKYQYLIEYTNNINVGSATVKITGINRYSGAISKKYKIAKYDIAKDTEGLLSVSLPQTKYSYVKAGVKPVPTVTFDGKTLVANKDYKVSYVNNKAVGGTGSKKPAVVIVGMGNYSGKNATATFSIGIKSLQDGDISIQVADKVATGRKNTWKSAIKVVDSNGTRLAAGRDYERTILYTYENGDEIGKNDIVPAGTVIKVKITGDGNYAGDLTGEYRIVANDIGKLTATVGSKIYSGRPITLGVGEITFKSGGKIVKNVTYTIDSSTYKNNDKKGKATVVIRGTGNYGGSKTITFDITSMSME